MNRTIGVCGHIKTGSSTVIRLLQEFEDAQVLKGGNIEFNLAYYADGLETLEYHVKAPHKYMSSVVAINRFRKYIKMKKLSKVTGGKAGSITDEFLSKIIQVTWNGYGMIDRALLGPWALYIKRCANMLAKRLKLHKLQKLYSYFFLYKMELSIMPEGLELASKSYISDVLDAMGRDRHYVTVLNQAFEACSPVKSFKYFDNPKAIIVDRDPRDHYIVIKKLLRAQGLGYHVPCDTVDDYIKYFRLVRQFPPDITDQEDVLFLNYEELVYDYENTVKKISDFAGVTEHSHKGNHFSPSQARNTTELFKKYTGFEADIEKIERELSEYLFNFGNYCTK